VPVCRIFALAIALAAAGCAEDICDRPSTAQPIPYRGGTTADCTYESSPWEGPLVPFPGGSFYGMVHSLGVKPHTIVCYVAFQPAGIEGGSVTIATGNEVEVHEVDDESFVILNDTCADFYVRCTAEADGCGGAGGAGGSP
jgi:hypothetical protein